jgi:hypothetical protein
LGRGALVANPIIKTCRCRRCAHTWNDYPGGFATKTRDGAGCPHCGHLYWDETNAPAVAGA